MGLSFERYCQIQKYLDDEMSPEEQRAFELLLENDHVIKQEVESERVLRSDMHWISANSDLVQSIMQENSDTSPEPELDTLRTMISNTHLTLREQSGNGKNIQPTKMLGENADATRRAAKLLQPSFTLKMILAACVITMVFVFALWIVDSYNHRIARNNNVVDSTVSEDKVQLNPDGLKQAQPDDTMYKDNYDPRIVPNNKGEQIASGQSVFKSYYGKDTVSYKMPEILSPIASAYIKNNYKSILSLDPNELPAIMGTEDIESEANIKAVVFYYKGLAYIEEKQYMQAAHNFQTTIDIGKDARMVNSGRWYCALALLKLNEEKKAIPLLNFLTIQKANNPYKLQADTILSLLTDKSQQ